MPESILSLSACGRHSVNNYAYVCAYYVYKTMERQQAKKKKKMKKHGSVNGSINGNNIIIVCISLVHTSGNEIEQSLATALLTVAVANVVPFNTAMAEPRDMMPLIGMLVYGVSFLLSLTASVFLCLIFFFSFCLFRLFCVSVYMGSP